MKTTTLEELKSNNSDNINNDSSPLRSIGNFIKEARISRNQSIEELASDLKIGTHQLQAIEAVSYTHLTLPTTPYV